MVDQMVKLGSGRFTYEVSGENWGNLPRGWTYKEAADVAVDSKDNVYVFNRDEHPMIGPGRRRQRASHMG